MGTEAAILQTPVLCMWLYAVFIICSSLQGWPLGVGFVCLANVPKCV
jgi:hypothetical protein